MAFNKADKADAPMRKKGGMRRRKKVCVFCGKDNVIDYKDVNISRLLAEMLLIDEVTLKNFDKFVTEC